MTSDAWDGGGKLTVQRDVNDSSSLVEVWSLKHLAWDDDNVGEYDVVKLYVADVNDVPYEGVPHSDRCVTDSCYWDELPDDVREQFISQVQRLRDAISILEHGADN